MIALALAAAASAVACDLPPGWDAVAARRTRYIIFGESHGTEQAPAFFGQVACALATDEKPLLIAVEQDTMNDPAFQLVWNGPDPTFAEALRKVPGWKGRDDGVASEAMFAMLVRLHRLRASGKNIDAVLFNGTKDDAQRARYASLPSQGPHEAAQAENIRVAAAAKPYDHILVLTGSLHARKSPVNHHGPPFLPMAMRLAPAEATTSLRMYSGAGTQWNCQLKPGLTLKLGAFAPMDAITCGKRPVQGMPLLEGPLRVALGMAAGVTGEGSYDGYVWLGPATASVPAVP